MPRKRTTNRKIVAQGGVVLFFCLFTALAFAGTPSVGTISPSSGSIAPNTEGVSVATVSRVVNN